MANTRCIVCTKKLHSTSLECHQCGFHLYCSVPCAISLRHPCHALQYFPSCTTELTALEKKLIGSILYLNPSQTCFEALLRAKIPGPAFECLFQIAGIFELWPHMAETRAAWVGSMACLLAEFHKQKNFLLDIPLTTLKHWSTSPTRYIPLFQPFIKENQADAILATIDMNELWRFVFGTDALFNFLFNLVQCLTQPVPLNFQTALKHLRIRRGGKGLDLIMFGKFIHLPFNAKSYDEARHFSRDISLPPKLYFIHDRQRWSIAQKVYIGWCLRRQTLAKVSNTILDRFDLFDWTVWHNTV